MKENILFERDLLLSFNPMLTEARTNIFVGELGAVSSINNMSVQCATITSTILSSLNINNMFTIFSSIRQYLQMVISQLRTKLSKDDQ